MSAFIHPGNGPWPCLVWLCHMCLCQLLNKDSFCRPFLPGTKPVIDFPSLKLGTTLPDLLKGKHVAGVMSCGC